VTSPAQLGQQSGKLQHRVGPPRMPPRSHPHGALAEFERPVGVAAPVVEAVEAVREEAQAEETAAQVRMVRAGLLDGALPALVRLPDVLELGGIQHCPGRLHALPPEPRRVVDEVGEAEGRDLPE
jgi:hypothetical protein